MKRKKLIFILSLSAVFLLALVLALLGKFVWGWFDGAESEPYVPPALEEGEAYYYFNGSVLVKDTILMYPQLERSDIVTVRVHNTQGENYFFYHNIEGVSNYFVLGQCEDETWEVTDEGIYFPSIIQAFSGAFDYTSLYDDTTTLPTMLAAVGAVKIEERLRPEDGNFSEEWLSHYGLADSDDPAYFEIITYLRDANGNYIYTDGGDTPIGKNPDDGKYYYLAYQEDSDAYTQGAEYTGLISSLTPMADTDSVRRVYVGNSTVDDSSYYIRLEGRDTVYTTSSSYLSQVVERDVGYYVAPRVVTMAESSYANQLSPNLSIFRGHYSEDITTVITDRMSLGVTVHDLWTVDSDSGKDTDQLEVFRQIDLTDETLDPAFLAAFVGAHIGDSRDIIVSTDNLADPGETLTYTIATINGVMDGNTYLTDPDRTVQAGDKLIVTYTCGNNDYRKGYIDLSDPYLPVSLRDALVGQTLGNPETPVSVTVTYDGSNSGLYDVVLGVMAVTQVTDREGNEQSAVTYGSAVTLQFYLKHDGILAGESDLITLYIPEEERYGEDDAWWELNGEGNSPAVMRALAQVLLGNGAGEWTDAAGNSRLETMVSYPKEVFSDFTMYRGARVEYVNAYEEVISFGYTNETSVYFGSSRYAITGPGDRVLYGLDSAASLTALAAFEDLIGDETVALGLTDEVMRAYGLYAYRIYYELPFDCYSVTDENDVQSYYYKSTIGYDLYISALQPDGSRYVGSSQYDVVVKFEDGSILDFAEWTFEEDWVQNNLLLVSYKDLRGLVVDLNFHEDDGEDFSHIWAFDVSVDRHYLYSSQYYVDGELTISYTENARMYAALVDGGSHNGMKSYSELRALLKYKGNGYYNYDDYTQVAEELQIRTRAGRLVYNISDTMRYILELDPDASPYTDLDAIYDYAYDPQSPDYYDGCSNLQVLLQIMNTTRYWGGASEDLTEEEMTALLTNDEACVMTIALTLADEQNVNYGYTLRFYSYSSHSLVSITDEASGNETHLFYIQTREVAKIAQAVVALTRGETLDSDAY